MRVLITGGAGFQGSHLAERLLRGGHDVTVLNTVSDDAKTNIALLKDDASIVWGSIIERCPGAGSGRPGAARARGPADLRP